MKWDVETLKREYRRISGLIRITNDPEKNKYYAQELRLIHSMIDYLLYNGLDGKKYSSEWIIGEEVKKKKVDYLGKNLSELTFRLDFLQYAEHLPVFLFVKKTIPEKDFVELVERFLLRFEFDLLTIYNRIVSHNALHLSPKPFFDSMSLGITNYLATFNISYVQTTFNGEITRMPCLPHEIGHAYQFNGVDHKRIEEMGYSVFREAFPHFVELAFIDFLKTTKYFKNAMNLERSFLEGMAVIRDLYGSEYMSTEKIIGIDSNSFRNNRGDEIAMPDTCRFVSKVLALYFLDLYRHHKDGIDIIADFNEMFRVGKEYEFVSRIPNEDLIKSVKGEFSQFHQDRHSRKSFKIDRKVK